MPQTAADPPEKQDPTPNSPGRRAGPVTLFGATAAGLVLLVSFLATNTTNVTTNGRGDPPPEDDASASAEPSGFVTRAGTELMLDGRPFRFTGFNTFVLFGCGRAEENIYGEAREAFFAGLRPNSVVRISMLPGTDLARFEEVVAAARRHGQRLMVALTDAHGHCGTDRKTEEWYAGGFRKDYLRWIRTVVPLYRDDPTIAMWELINEPYGADTATLRRFFDEAGGLVHELAPNHLVSSGTLLPDTYGGVEAFTELHASPGIDVVSLHEYDQVADASHHLVPALAAAKEVDKPLVVGEWGLYAGPPGAAAVDENPCYTFDERVPVAEGKLAAYLSTPGVAGALYWSYTAEGVPSDADVCALNTTAGDPLVDLIRNIPIPPADQK